MKTLCTLLAGDTTNSKLKNPLGEWATDHQAEMAPLTHRTTPSSTGTKPATQGSY